MNTFLKPAKHLKIAQFRKKYSVYNRYTVFVDNTTYKIIKP